MRTKFEGAGSSQQSQGKDNFRRDQGAARAISSFIDPSLSWKDLKQLKEAAGDMKIVLKGVQSWEVSLGYSPFCARGLMSRTRSRPLSTEWTVLSLAIMGEHLQDRVPQVKTN